MEAKRLQMSRAVTRRPDGKQRKLMFIDAIMAHVDPSCEQDIYIRLAPECGAPAGTVGNLDHQLYGMRPAAAAWEKHSSDLLESKGFIRGEAC